MKLTPDQLRQNAAAMIALADQKTIQFQRRDDKDWSDYFPGLMTLPDLERYQYRPKPEPKVRPWTFEEAPVMLKVKHKRDKSLSVAHLRGTGFHIFGFADCTFDYVAQNFTQLDGSPCGVVET